MPVDLTGPEALELMNLILKFVQGCKHNACPTCIMLLEARDKLRPVGLGISPLPRMNGQGEQA
jgi:hypothetical protein